MSSSIYMDNQQNVAFREPQQERVLDNQGVATRLLMTEKYRVITMDTSRIHVLDVNGNPMYVFQEHTGGVWAAALSHDMLASGGKDTDLRLWDLCNG
jgi:WD40 repeat protein